MVVTERGVEEGALEVLAATLVRERAQPRGQPLRCDYGEKEAPRRCLGRGAFGVKSV
ncbi:hypothetical protein KDA_41700 [Dictyobacter alpinus]|uniref:Uncharacterized protein n=1 Tax=Dictyobacter alpinus TaxID=2014873 RepID=A0A402BBJ2_9CHLR|nr:hypothetical protein [Dictyobacter alpinus]GCE28686.1 hypothetical protein KDA_41700 [Dictyobacter alpinus]